MPNVLVKPLNKAPTNNAVRYLRYLRKREKLAQTPNTQFPLIFYK